MFSETFFHGTLRKYTVFFGTLFNNLYVERLDDDGVMIQRSKVPLNYGPKEKFLARALGNPDSERPIALSLPRISFEMKGFRYDGSRKTSTVLKIAVDSADPDIRSYTYAPVPYDIAFSLYIMVKNADDGNRIVEQILPYFTPEWSATLNLNDDLNTSFDIPLILDSVSNMDTYEGNFIERRALIWTLTFTMKGWMFGPTKTQGVIKQAEVNIKAPLLITLDEADANTLNSVEYVVIPGLTANGEPTSNSALSIDKSLIESTDDYGYIEDLTENY